MTMTREKMKTKMNTKMDTKNIGEKEFLNQFSSLDKTGHWVELPEIEIDQKYVKQYNLPKGFKNFDFLKSLCDNRLREYVSDKSESKKKEYQDRLDYELDLIEELSFTDYFLLIWDVCNFCREKGILLGHGRGCLHPYSKIRTKSGLKYIKDIQKGDVVLNGFGRWDDVRAKHEYDCDEDLIKINLLGIGEESVSLTKDHEVLVLEGSYLYEKNYPSVPKTKWVTSEDIKIGDVLIKYNGEDTKPYFQIVQSKEIVKNEYGKVYDLTMGGDSPSYSTENYTVHNSACGSLILFLINVTKIDPIRYELYFERFVSRARAKKTVVDGVTYLDGSLMCDVDIDIDYYRRPEVIEYVSNKYKGRVCHILNVNTLTSKILIKECGKIVAAKSDQEMTKISSFIESKFGTVDSLEETRKKSPKFDNWCKENKRAFQVAQKLNGLPRNKGVHASGIIVSKHNLDETLPVELTKDGNLVSSYSKNTVELLTIKLDLLGVKTLSVVDEVCKIVGLNIDEINIEDPYIYQICQDLDSRYGLFQISEDTAYKTTRAIKPRNIEDLSAVLAIARPGALQFIEPYSKYTASGDPPSLHPVLDPHLKESGNMLIYQEQLMRIASKVFGLSLEDGENIRRGVGKKKKEIIEKFEPILKKAGEEKGYDPEVFEIYWKLLHDSASYSFNKCLDPDTLVETPYGNKRIGDLNIGDKVYSYDFEVDEVVESTVTQTYVSNKQAVEYEFESKDKVISSKSHKFMEKTSGRMIPIKSLDDFQCDFKLCLD